MPMKSTELKGYVNRLKTAANGRKLPPEFKARWVHALRSGEFRQASGNLRVYIDDDLGNRTYSVGHCCLGVVCEIQGRTPKLDEVGFLTSKAIGIPNMLIGENAVPEVLAGMNDKGASFKQIARTIEKHL